MVSRATTDDIDNILAVAAMFIKADQSQTETDIDAFAHELEKMAQRDIVSTIMAIRLMQGRPYRLHSDNLETTNRLRRVAKHMGASAQLWTEADGRVVIEFSPPTRQ